ncbi:hypothetical protein [Microbacteriaceae]|uniref:Uncharacterized protein n=3 Tax=Microbacteriaceae TaxID=85023 RepID=A0A4R6RTF0_9MICO|nr:hypothetical protein [Microbacteriaceae]RLP67562.1 hypothetical protein D9V30_13940 [Mycetocola reblochoni]TDP90122.1 hypothetical protein EDF62_2687 [Leucobacter luti]
MTGSTETMPPLVMYVVHAKGANRISYLSVEKISEAFDKDSTPTVGSLCAIVREGDEELGTGNYLIGLAVTRGVAGIASGTLRATLSPVLRLLAPLELGELREQAVSMSPIPQHFYAHRLDSPTARALLDYLRQTDPTVGPWLDSVFRSPRTFDDEVQQSRIEARDAVLLASQIADVPLPADAFSEPPSASENETLLDTVLNAGYERDMEEELLPLDLQRFDGKLIADQRAASLAVFEDHNGQRKLLVMSVNKKPIEEELGIDLLYWDQVHDAFTFVQYKRLERADSGDENGSYEWVYRRKNEIEKQLNLMPKGREVPKKAADWRAFDTPFWFKFVRGDAGRKLDGKTLKGMYVSADWMRLAMTDSTFKVGPRGGFRVTYKNTKYLLRGVFAQLISRGFIGTASTRSQAFRKAMQNLGADRELIIAIKTEWQEDTEREPAPVSSDAPSPALPF